MTQPNLDVETCAVVGVRMSSVGTSARLPALAALCEVQTLDGGALFVVVPGFDQHKRQGMGRVKIAIVEVQGIFESLPAPVRHVPIQAPLCRGIVEARPGRTDRNLVGMLVAHGFVEIVEIPFAPIASVRRPSLLSGLHPGIGASNRSDRLRRRLVLVNQVRRGLPSAAMLSDTIPVHVPMFRKNENHGMAVVREISAMMRGVGADVPSVSLVKSHKG